MTKDMLEKYRVGTISKADGTSPAVLYYIPASNEAERKFKIYHTITSRPVGQLRRSDDNFEIWYETIPDSFKMAVYRQVKDSELEEVLSDIGKTIGLTAAA